MSNIFISYSHDSKQHADRVLSLSNRLIKEGLDCILDLYVENPEEGWPKWMDRHLEEAEYVIIICTHTYCERVMGKAPLGKGKGVKWESTLTYQYIYEADSNNDKFIPVVFKEDDCRYIPPILKGFTHYCPAGEDGYDRLYRRLTGQPEIIKPKKGQIKKRPPRKMPDAFPIDTSPLSNRISLAKMPGTGADVFGREKELEILDKAWQDEHCHIVILQAWGGVGKTAIVNYWLNLLEKENYKGAAKVYAWSFYSQGAEEGKQASADEFFQETLNWFNDPHPEQGTNVEKGRRLSQLVRKEKSLIILDGLEPIQYPPGEIHGFDGKLKDAGLSMFLKELAADMRGLCVITTREKVQDLQSKKGFAVKEIELENLSETAGVLLLKNLGATVGSERDFRQAVKEYGGHALALTLLGNYIKKVFAGDIRKRDEINKLAHEKIQGGRHANRVMAAYESWLGASPERDILYMMGLFDRPVEPGAIEALKKSPAIHGVTDRLQDIGDQDWQLALSNLREAGLLAKESPNKPGMLDCHPLVREYFGDRLRQQNPKGWQQAHQRLYEYYKALPRKELPDTLAEMEPLFAAVAHGSRAGLHQEALIDVYWKRIRREEKAYSIHKLGAFGADLAAVSHFFEVAWSRPAHGLTDHDKASVLNWAAFELRALGRLTEAIQPMQASLEMAIKQKKWENAAIAASSLSELMLTLGDVTRSVSYARQSVEYADRSGDEFWKEVSRTALADALHQAGKIKEAEQLFLQAEAMQKKRQPQYPFLYSLRGYQFCDLMLGLGRYREALKRAEKLFEWRIPSDPLLDISLDNLTAGRAWLLHGLDPENKDKKEQEGAFKKAKDHLDQAVNGLRKSGNQDDLPRGLLARAEYWRTRQQYDLAEQDLAEAYEIAELGSMKLYLVDYHIESGRLCRAQSRDGDAQDHFQKAEALIEETGYHRRDREIERSKRYEIVIGHW